MQAFLNYVERFRLTTKLAVGLSVGVIVAIIVGYNALMTLSRLDAEVEKLYENDLLGISYIKDANLDLIYMSRAMRHALIAPDEVTRNAALASVKRMREKLLADLVEARQRMVVPQTIARYEEFQGDLTKALESIEQAVAMIQKEDVFYSPAARLITSGEFAAIVAKADDGLHELTALKGKNAERKLEILRTQAERTHRYAIATLIVGVLLAGILGALIAVSILRPSERVRQAVEALAAGEVDKPIPHADYPNEIGVMARSVGVLQGIYRMSKDQHWVKSHANEVAAAIQQVEDFRALAQATLSQLAPAIGAGHGAFYIADASGRFGLQASYGYRERKHLSNSFAFGEGLVGQCAMEKAAIVLSAPKDYIRINSGLGEGPPACVAVLPIIHGERVLGVLEMASFQQFSEREKALLDAVLPTLATGMEILDRNLKARELLAATQEQAERMEKQAAQLEEQSVEMEAQQAELLETENWFRSIIDAAPDGMLVADTRGEILLTNPALERIFGYASGELIGGSIEQLVPDAHRHAHRGMREGFMREPRSRSMGEGSQLAGKTKDGAQIAVHVTLCPLPSRGARGKCVSASVRKIETQPS